MELNVKEISASEKEIEVTLTYEEIKQDIEAEVRKQTKSIQLPGFRKGKVPMHIIKKRFGDALELEASETVANKRFWEIADEKELNPIGRPVMTDIQFKPGEDLHFKVKYEVLPTIEVKDYTGLEIEVPDLKVTQEEVDKEIDYIIRTNRTTEDADIVGDDNNYILEVDLFKLNDKGEPETDKPEKIQIDLTQEGVNKEIIENAKGKKAGDSFTFGFDDERTVQNEEGKEETVKDHYEYKIVITGIKKIIDPELNEEFIKKITKDRVSSLEELKKDIEKDIQNYYDKQMEEITEGSLIEKIIKNNDFKPPVTLVNNVLDNLIENEVQYMKKQGVTNVDTKALREKYAKTAENDVKWILIKQEIIKKENIEVTDEDLKELAEKEAEKTGISVDKLMNFYKNSDQKDKLTYKKLFDFLKEKNTIKKVDPEKFKKTQTEAVQ